MADLRYADSTPSWPEYVIARMHRAQVSRSQQDELASVRARLPSVVVLVGEAAREDHRIQALLSSNVVVILLPSLESANALFDIGNNGGETRLGAPTSTVGDLLVDLTKHRVLWGQRELPVSERELAMLATLSQHPGRACTYAELAEPEGGKWLGDKERVHSAIKRLRRKLASAGVEGTIESVPGYGFGLVERSNVE